MQQQNITTLFLDIGGVLLSNGWDRNSRKLAAIHFNLDLDEMNERHHLTFDTYEMGKISLDEYLNRIVFYEKKDFSRQDFKTFMYSQSVSYPETIDFFKELKANYKLKIISVNNEGRELNEHRIKEFKLDTLFDAFVCSCYVALRKPDADIFRMACNISNALPVESIMIDDRLMFVEVAAGIGIHGLHFADLATAKEKLKGFGLSLD